MKVTSNGVTIDFNKIRTAVLPGRQLDMETVFESITVETPSAPKTNETLVIEGKGSSSIEYALYVPDDRRLLVQFKRGGMYRYEGISLQTAFDLAQADSKGSFFHSYIRNRFIAHKVGR